MHSSEPVRDLHVYREYRFHRESIDFVPSAIILQFEGLEEGILHDAYPSPVRLLN